MTTARGATVIDGGVRFSVWAPRAQRVAVRTSTGDHDMIPCGDGVFEATVPGAGEGSEYSYVLDGDRVLPDPASRYQPEGVHGVSRVVDPRLFSWTDEAWRGVVMPDYVIYELHVGTFTDAGTFEAIIPHLAGLRALGITAIELMPVAQFPGARNWGYDGTYPYAPQNSYGGPHGLRTLVDAAHAAGLAVILDVVYNHLGPEGNYLDAFAPYFTDVYRTPWGRAVNYDGPDSDEVRRYVIENALYWITDFHVDALRLDAIHDIHDFSAEHVLGELTDAVHARAERLGRTVCVIAESDLNDPRVVRTRAEGGLGFDAQWSDDFHHAVHAALTGEQTGYYADFGGVAPVAAALREPFVRAGQYSRFRRRRHGASAAGIPRYRFVVSVQNHDQVGNRAAGDRLPTLVSHARLRLAAALLLLSAYVPLIFMGEEFGETQPFNYFVSHTDTALLDAVSDGRRAEFAAFGWADDVPDPAAEATFAASKLQRSRLAEPVHASLRALYSDLLQLRRTEPALRPGDAEVRVTTGARSDVNVNDDGWIRLELQPHDAAARGLVAIFNLSGATRTVPFPESTHGWATVLATTDERYWTHTGDEQLAPVLNGQLSVSVPSDAAVLFAAGGV